VENFGPALLDRALLDALCRALGISFYQAVRTNAPGIAFPDLDMPRFLAGLQPRHEIAARHTVGLVDPITSADNTNPVGDGLPETLEEVITRYAHRWFKLKVGGDVQADVERLRAIASVLDRIPGDYHASFDGNEQYEDVQGVLELWRRIREEPRLERLASNVVFIEQPIKRHKALAADISALAAEKPVIIDESDDSLDAFPRAKALGYRGVSSKTCKGIYKSLINAARCAAWGKGYFMSGEDLTVQAGLALQQDLALVSILGLTHVERNGHHYVNGMAGLPADEQERFLKSHADLYERSHGAVRVTIRDGKLQLGSLDCPGYASRAMPDWGQMREMPFK
jgi:L-alanine-DL-glutamate epimerase-like enolase superfamily enzyme